MSPEELNTLMLNCSEDAVNLASTEFEITLDHSPESVVLVDDILLQFIAKYHDKALEDKAVFTICNVFGAYVGEILKSQIGGQWIYDQTDPEAPTVFLAIGENTYAFAGVCYERLVNDNDVSVKSYYELAYKNHKFTQH